MAGYDVLRQVIARRSGARAKGAAVQLMFNLGVCLWPRLLAVEVTPDEAMTLSIELQKAALDARQSASVRGRCGCL
jgi:hypothetical protein